MTDKPTQEITLTIEQANKLIELCENPPEPTEELKAAARKYKERTNMTDKTDEELIVAANVEGISGRRSIPARWSDGDQLLPLIADRLSAALEREKELKRLIRVQHHSRNPHYFYSLSRIGDKEAIEKIVGEK